MGCVFDSQLGRYQVFKSKKKEKLGYIIVHSKA